MEGKLNKQLILTIIKYSPWIIGFAYCAQLILGCFGLQSILLTVLFNAAVFQ